MKALLTTLCLLVLTTACAGPMQQPMTASAAMQGQMGMNGMMGSAGVPQVGMPGGMYQTVAATMPAGAGMPYYAGTDHDVYTHPQMAQQWMARRAMFAQQATAMAQAAPVVNVAAPAPEASGGEVDSRYDDPVVEEVGRLGEIINQQQQRGSR